MSDVCKQPIRLRPAVRGDMARVIQHLRDLAQIEQRAEGRAAVRASEEQLWAMLAGERPSGECVMVELASDGGGGDAPAGSGATVIGHAWFVLFGGTFGGRPWFYLEDVYLAPAHRGGGLGRVVMAALARIAIERNCAGMVWSVVKANTGALRFYERLGAELTTDNVEYSLSGEALERLAESSSL